MEKGSDILVSSFADQWARTWDRWEEMIQSIPEGEWTKGDIDYLIPARHLVHAACGDDFFTSVTPRGQYDNLQWFGVGEWVPSPDELPGKEAALAKLVDIRATVQERLDQLDDAALLQPEKVHPWTSQTRVGKLLYNLRHIQHHLGEINAELIRRGIDGVGWR
jgi:hypothetical protein